MAQPVVKARRTYSRYVANQTLEDFSLRYTAGSARNRSSFTVANAALGSISFLALEVIGANIAIYYGLNHLFFALLLTVPLIFLISKPIASYAVKYNVDIDLLTRGAGFGYLGSSITSLVYASFTFIFLAFEATILANMMYMAFALPIYIGYFVSAVIVIPLILNGFSFISRFQRITQPLWGLLQLISILGCVLMVRESDFSLNLTDQGKDSFNWLFFGFSVSILLSLVSQIGEQVDYLRFMPERTKANKKAHCFGTVLAGPGWIVLGGLKIFIGAILGVYLLGQGYSYSSAVDPNYMYLEVFSYITDYIGIDSHFPALFLTVVFVCLSQIKINITNGYAGSLAWSNFFSRLTHTHPGRVVWVFFNVIIAYILTSYGIYSISASVLSTYSIVAVAWCGTLLADLSINKKIGLSPDRIEFKRAYLYDINPVGFGSMILSSILGYMAFFGVFGQYLTAFCAPFTLILTLIFCPLLAILTHGKYYLARKVVKIEGVHECQICKNNFDGEDLCYCPRYGGFICSLCCTLDSCCFDECKNKADIHHQIEDLLIPKRLKNPVSKRIMRFAGHLLMYTLVNVIVLYFVYYSLIYHFSAEYKRILQSGFLLCFLLFEFIFILFSMMFMLVEESRNRAQEELHNQNLILENEVSERKKTEMLLSEAKKNADAANQAKSRYLSGISHELRTPLNTIIGYSQLLYNADDIPDRHLKAIGIMCRSSDYLANLIEGLLDISKIEAGRLELHYGSVNLKRLIDELTAYFEEKSHRKGIIFITDISPKLPDLVRTDEKRIRQILINLLSNAIKYTVKGEVYFSVSYRNEVAKFIVKDSGIGIKKDDLKKIFEPFNRLADAKKQASGTGLGLTITKLMVTIMGGDLEVESTYGVGTTFTLKIKLSRTFDNPAVSTLERTVISYQGQDIKKYKVLEVDDNPFHRDLVKEILIPVGFIVDTATCPKEVLVKDNLGTYDLFLVDVAMPGHDGWYLLTQLRQRNIKTPVIMVSAEASEGNVPDSIRHLHNGYIIKPFKQKQLFDSISKVLPINYIYKDSEDSKTEALHQDKMINRSVQSITEKTAVNHIDCSQIKLDDSIKGRYKINFEIGYISGIRKLNNEILDKSIITSEQKRYLDSLLDNMELNVLQEVLGVK